MSRVLHGDCIEIMRTLPDNSVDSIVTDPPYGLGFMGKAWDALPPGLEWAVEARRVLKPGGHLLAFGGTRTWHRLAVAVEDAGMEVRDSIAWLYGSGFPKHRAALKPAFEPAVLARKPFKGSLTANEAAHGTGALDIDGSRIGTSKEVPGSAAPPKAGNQVGMGSMTALTDRSGMDPNVGRWPANVVLDEDMAAVLDGQSGISKSPLKVTQGQSANQQAGAIYSGKDQRNKRVVPGHDDTGGASRFFYVAKAPKSERPVVDGVAHATVKPLALMRHLVKLVTPAGGVVLDPFAGSGTTAEAAILEGFEFIAIEREAEYLPLIQSRLDRANALAVPNVD
jgi:site-specific DNA-methyltransferase (adenine-specific)